MTPKPKIRDEYDHHLETVFIALEKMERAELKMKAAQMDYYAAKSDYDNLSYLSQQMDRNLSTLNKHEPTLKYPA